MNTKEETAQKYYAAIGEFVVVYAGLEMHLTKFIATKKLNAKLKHFGLSVTIAPEFDAFKKAAKINEYILFQIPLADEQFKDKWISIYSDLKKIIDARHYLVHGVVTGFVFFDPIDTFLRLNKEDMKCRKFHLQEIYDLILMSRKISSELTGDFWHSYTKLLGHNTFYLTSINLGSAVSLQRPAIDPADY